MHPRHPDIFSIICEEGVGAETTYSPPPGDTTFFAASPLNSYSTRYRFRAHEVYKTTPFITLSPCRISLFVSFGNRLSNSRSKGSHRQLRRR